MGSIYVAYSLLHDWNTIASHSASARANASRYGETDWRHTELRCPMGAGGNDDYRTCSTARDIARTIGFFAQGER